MLAVALSVAISNNSCPKCRRASALSGTGCSAPLEVQLLPQRRGLGGAGSEASCGGIKLAAGGVKKKRRGGERSRRKKQAAVVREGKEAARDEETRAEVQKGPSAAGMFSFINSQLGETNFSYHGWQCVLYCHRFGWWVGRRMPFRNSVLLPPVCQVIIRRPRPS